MEHLITKIRTTILFCLVILLPATIITSCYYDNAETLYPDSAVNCDTTNITYSGTVAPIMASRCNACHSGSAPSAGVTTSSFEGLSVVIDDGRYRGAINHLSGYSPMPKDGNKLSDCDLARINHWLDLGAPNN